MDRSALQIPGLAEIHAALNPCPRTIHSVCLNGFLITRLIISEANLIAGESSLAARYPGDIGIEEDPAVLFADNFESGNLRKWDQVRGSMIAVSNAPHAGSLCAEAEMV